MAELALDPHKRISPLLRSKMMVASHARTVHVAYIEYGATKEKLLEPDFWKHVSTSLRIGDRIELYCEAGTFYGEAIVLNTGVSAALIKILNWHELTGYDDREPAQDPLRDQYIVKWGNPTTQWRIIRTADNEVVKEHLPTKEVAYRELDDYIKALHR